MTTTSFYKAYDQPYRVIRDEKKTWRIYDLRNPIFSSFGPEDDIPDDSPVVKVITEGEFIALIHAAIENGVVENAVLTEEDLKEDEAEIEKISELQNKLDETIKEKEKLEIELGHVMEALENEKSTPKVQHTESFLIKSKALEAIKALAVAEDLQKFNA